MTEDDVVVAQITTRDIDRGNYRHYLLKEISESPASFRKTLRGKLVERDGRPHLALGDEVIPADVRDDLAAGRITRVIAIGQGTAHVAGQSFVAAPGVDGARPITTRCVAGHRAVSGFGLRADMRDTLVVAISQSGTTTDTNRTVDLVRSRGARVVAIVNRRNSDLTDKADGVLYTSDGRDVEMSVASTKALYSQIAAGFLLAGAITETLGGTVDAGLLSALRTLPDAMAAVVDRRPEIGVDRAAARAVPPLLGDRRQRHEPHRGQRAAHQALRALLQGDRLRLDRGQEAHRPLVRAAHPRVRGRTHRFER